MSISDKILGEQFKDIMVKALSPDEMKDAALTMSQEIDRDKNEKTLSGQSPAENGEWDNVYSDKYAKSRNKPTSPVTLRDQMRRIEQTEFIPVDGDAIQTIFTGEPDERDGLSPAKIFQLHQSGRNWGRRRQIYPESVDQVPEEFKIQAQKIIKEKIRGA